MKLTKVLCAVALVAGIGTAITSRDLPANCLQRINEARCEAEVSWGDKVAYIRRHGSTIEYPNGEISAFYGLQDAAEGDYFYAHFDGPSIVITKRPSKTAEVIWAQGEDWFLAREIGLTFRVIVID